MLTAQWFRLRGSVAHTLMRRYVNGKIMAFTESDKEILEILKGQKGKQSELIDPDELLRRFFLKAFFFMSLLGLLAVVVMDFTGVEDVGIVADISAMFFALFFGCLTLYINSKSENFSVLTALFTIASLLLGYYLGSR
ncbi:hypothetical protein [Vibrio parahaemolyticus]|uniref:hypothetical protein n=1 Tax=Vibrio parahaemolyticus TaxID=670 RepID=UPI0015864BB1|nr:hypothetical protein [Vibrio parahaemolyticus]EJG1717105.1 hypothetical protein [Vibrio parahaemolyticus]HCG7179466.1 hypothetical protein [Vibrio parahaemolyticus]